MSSSSWPAASFFFCPIFWMKPRLSSQNNPSVTRSWWLILVDDGCFRGVTSRRISLLRFIGGSGPPRSSSGRYRFLTTSASPIRRYGPDTTYFAPLCLAWDGRAFSWLQVLGVSAEDSTPPSWSDVVWRQKDSPRKWQAPWSWCNNCGSFGCHASKTCPVLCSTPSLFKGGFSQRLSRRIRKFYGLPQRDVALVV